MIRDPAEKARTGQRLTLDVPAPAAATPLPQRLPLDILYEDNHLIVIDKPAGLVVHPAPGNPDRTLVNALLAHCGDGLTGIGDTRRPGIVHRLDKDTSGVLVAAKNERAHRGLVEQFAAHSVERAYLAVVRGVPQPGEGRIDAPIGRSPRDRKRMAVVERGGRAAVTRFRVTERFGTVAAAVECRLQTGRTHQIRVHMSVRGHPLLGDPLYGGRRRSAGAAVPAEVAAVVDGFPRQALHAAVLGFRHPVGDRPLRFETPVPDDLATLLCCLRRL